MRRVSELVTLHKFQEGATDGRGNPVESWDTTGVSVGVYGFAPGGESEPVMPGHDRVISEPTLYVPESVVFGAFDRVTVRGQLYEVQGETRVWRHPSGLRPGNVIGLKKVTG